MNGGSVYFHWWWTECRECLQRLIWIIGGQGTLHLVRCVEHVALAVFIDACIIIKNFWEVCKRGAHWRDVRGCITAVQQENG